MGVDFLGKGEIASSRSEIAEHSRWVIAPEERKRDLRVAAPGIPPRSGRSAADDAPDCAPEPVSPVAGGSPAVAVQAALSAGPGGVAVA